MVGAPNLTKAQKLYLSRGLQEPGGKLPLFDADGQRISDRTVRACMRRGWAAPWYRNPLKPDWLVCRLTDAGRAALQALKPTDPAMKMETGDA